jgi:hypothetical protein
MKSATYLPSNHFPCIKIVCLTPETVRNITRVPRIDTILKFSSFNIKLQSHNISILQYANFERLLLYTTTQSMLRYDHRVNLLVNNDANMYVAIHLSECDLN